MEALKILKRIAFYIVYMAAGLLLFSQSEKIALYQFTYTVAENGTRVLSNDLFNGVYLPLMLALLSLAILLLTEFVILKDQDENTERIFGIANIVFFGISLAAAIFVVVFGLVKINADTSLPSSSYLICPMIPLIGVSLAEVVFGIVKLTKTPKPSIEEESKI